MFTDYLTGITSYFKAFQLIGKLRLWKFVMAPGILSLILGGGIGWTAWKQSEKLGNFLVSWYPWERGMDFISGIAIWIGGFLIVILGLILYKHLVMVLVSPFMSPLSEKVERHLNGNEGQAYKGFQMGQAIKDILRGLTLAIRNIIRELFLVAIFFLLSFIPVVGIIFTVGIFLVQAYYAGFGNMDYTLERHQSVSGSVKFIRKNRWLAMGNGTVFMLLLMTGIGFLIAPPLSTIAGTVEVVKRLDGNENHNFGEEQYV